MKTLTIVLNRGSYISEFSDIALNIGLKALEKGHNVNLYLYIDGVWVPHLNQIPKEFPNAQEKLEQLIEAGANVKICARCAEARGVTSDTVIEGLPFVGLYDLIDWIKESDKVISITG